LSPPQARQVCDVVLQIGAVPAHCALETQETQLPAPLLQTGVAPPHWAELVDEHWPQAPHGSQAGVEPPHSPSPAQPRQAWVVVLQTGVEPLHCALLRQGTQIELGV
jgi:hypothetical protein